MVFIRNRISQKNADLEGLVRMVKTMQGFFPLEEVKPAPKDFHSHARRSIGSLEELKEHQTSHLIISAKTHSLASQSNRKEKQLRAVIKINSSRHFLDKYLATNSMPGSKDQYL